MRAREWEQAIGAEIDRLETEITASSRQEGREKSEVEFRWEGYRNARMQLAARLRALLEHPDGPEEDSA